MLDVVAALVEVHSANKQRAAYSYKGGFGFHPMCCFPAATGEALAGVLRPGNANANSGADQLAVVHTALAQLPERHRAGHRPGDSPESVEQPVVVRADTAGAVASFMHGLVARNVEFSVGGRVNDQLSAAIAAVAADAWRRPIDDGVKCATPARWPSSTSPWMAGRRAPAPSAAASSPTPAPSCVSGTATAGAIR